MAKGAAGPDPVQRHRALVEAASRRDLDDLMDPFDPDVAEWRDGEVIHAIKYTDVDEARGVAERLAEGRSGA